MSSTMQHSENCWSDILIGDRIVLKRMYPTFQNAQLLCKNICENRDHLSDSFKFLVHKITSVSSALTYLQAHQKECELGYRDSYGIFVKDDFVGMICVWGDRHKKRELLYWLKSEACGHGFMKEALGLVECEQAKCAPNKALLAIVKETAIASIALLNKCGYFSDELCFWKIPEKPIMSRIAAKFSQLRQHTQGYSHG